MDWLWQNLLSSILWEILLLIGGGALLTLLKTKAPKWGTPILYGIAAMACLAVILFTLTGHAILSKQTPETTTENIEGNILAWSDKFGIGIQRAPAIKDSHFAFATHLRDGNSIFVARTNEQDRYLTFRAYLTISAEHLEALNKMTPVQYQRTMDEIELELARSRIGYVFQFNGPRSYAIEMASGLPINHGLDDNSFIARLDEMDASLIVAKQATRLAIARNRGAVY